MLDMTAIEVARDVYQAVRKNMDILCEQCNAARSACDEARQKLLDALRLLSI